MSQSTIYSLEFNKKALKEFEKLDPTIQLQFIKKLEAILVNPHIPANRLHGDLAGLYKVKLRAKGFRAVYQVIDDKLVVLVLAVGKRDKDAAYSGI